jgi:hypothetical protein
VSSADHAGDEGVAVHPTRGRARETAVERRFTGDNWTDANLLRADERLADARALALLRARRGDPPRHGSGRIRLGAVLRAVGHRLWQLGARSVRRAGLARR